MTKMKPIGKITGHRIVRLWGEPIPYTFAERHNVECECGKVYTSRRDLMGAVSTQERHASREAAKQQEQQK